MKKVGRFFSSIVSGLFGLLTGCNGVPSALYMGPPPSVGGTVCDDTSKIPIAALRVELLRGDTSIGTNTTDSNGNFYFTIPTQNTNYTLRITDIDGTNNGGEYRGSTNTFHVQYELVTNIQLEKNT